MSEFDGINDLTDAERSEIRESTARQFRGLYDKFTVQRTDGTDGLGQKHDGCRYFVLDLEHDRHAAAGLEGYAASCQTEYPALATDLREHARRLRRTIANRRIGSPTP